MSRNPIRKVVIAGGGTAGWMAAAVIARNFTPGTIEIILIESPDVATVGVGEATIPPILSLNRQLGFDENEFIKATKATFKLGIEFRNWGDRGEAYIHPFGSYGADVAGTPFHHFWLRQRASGDETPLDAYCLPIAAIRENRFARPVDDPRNVLSKMSYAFHFDATLYAAYLKELALSRGVTHMPAHIAGVNLEETRGFVRSLTLKDGREIDGDLFIDCTGFKGLLIEDALETGYEDWSHWLPVDAAWAMPTANEAPPPLYTTSTAHPAGWQWRIQLQHRTGNGHVFSTAFMDKEEAQDILTGNVSGTPLADPRLLRFKSGRRRKAWNRNVVSVGLSSGFIEPLESTSIHFIQAGLTLLMTLFPDRDFAQQDIDAYNRTLQEEYEHARDFIILHYHASRRDDSGFWRHVRSVEKPETLMRRIELFRSHGRVQSRAEDLFTPTSWLAVMLGQGIIPEGWDPMANQVPTEALAPQMAKMAQIIARGAGSLPTHQEFIDRYCKAES